MTRKIMWATAFPHFKKLPEIELLPFPWDENIIKEISTEESEKLIKEAEAVKEFYKKQDAATKSQNV